MSSETPNFDEMVANAESAPSEFNASKIKARHGNLTKEEVDAFADRMDDIKRIVDEYLNEDPMEAEKRRKSREELRAKEKAEAARKKIQDRYDPRRYIRFESDELINTLLQEVDVPKVVPPKQRIAHMTDFERLNMEEAERMKAEGNKYFKEGDMQKANEQYSKALDLIILDDDLVMALRNNRSQTSLTLKNFTSAVEDATFVLKHHPRNTKALLRRATALSALHRPHEALVDLQHVITGEPQNAEAIKLIEAVKVEQVEMEQCWEYERTSKSAVAELAKNIEALKAIADSPMSVQHTLEHTFLEKALTLLCAAGESLLDQGSTTYFRIHGGLAASNRLLSLIVDRTVAPSSDTKPQMTADLAGKLVFVISAALRLFSMAYTSRVAKALLPEAEAKRWIDLCCQFIARRGPNYEALSAVFKSDAGNSKSGSTKTQQQQKSKSLMNENMLIGKSALHLLVAAALQALESMSSHFPALIVQALPIADARGLFSAASPDAPMYFGMKLFDVLLRSDVGKNAYAELDLALPSVAASYTNNMSFAEAGVAMLLRLSVVQPERTDVLNREDFIRHLCEKMSRRVDDKQGPSAIMREGICSLLYNKVLQTNPRNSFIDLLQRHGLFATIVDQLNAYARSSFDDPESCRPWISVASRLLALLGKAAPVNADVANLLVPVEDTVLWKMLDLRLAFPSAMSAVSFNANETAEENRYIHQCLEHSTLCLAVLYTNKLISPSEIGSRKNLATLLSLLLLKRQPVTIGNVAMLLSQIPKECHTIFAELKFVDVMLQALIDVRSELHDLERLGMKDTTLHQHTKGAQKNLAIALSRVSQTESLLNEMRDKRGFEVLYAALDRNPDGTVKDVK